MRLSVLDTSPIVQGSTPKQALENTVDLAVLADSLGYHRYWVPEHHGMRGVASSAPAVLVGHLAAVTSRIRVGAGGVLLPNHAPIVVAEQFGTLAAPHPGRIDLGIGRAPGGSPAAAAAVRPSATPFRALLEELRGYLDESAPVPAVPVLGGNVPPVWLLGMSPSSAALAAELDLPYAYAHHLTGRTIDARPDLVSVTVIVAETDERAEWLAGPTRLKVLSRQQGRRTQLPSPATVKEKLASIQAATGTPELMVTTPVYHHEDRRRSYELLATVHHDTGTSTERSASATRATGSGNG